VGYIYGKRGPKVPRDPVVKISVYLPDAIENAALDPEALQLIEFFIRVPDSPAVKIYDPNGLILCVNKVSRMIITMLIYWFLLPYQVDILFDKTDHGVIAGDSKAGLLIC